MWNRIAARAQKSQATSRDHVPVVLLTCLLLLPENWTGKNACPTGAPGEPPRAEAADPHKIRAQRYEIEVRLEPQRGFLNARTALTLEILEPLAAVEIELNPQLQIQEVSDGLGRKLAFDRSPRLGSPKLLVRLAEPCRPGQRITLTFVYEGAPLLRGLDYFNKDGILLRDDSRWYPAVDLSAFTQNDITIEIPLGWDAFASGEPARPAGGRSGGGHAAGTYQAYRWKTQAPVSSRSLVAFPTGSHYLCETQSAENPAPADLRHAVSSCFPREQQDFSDRLHARVSSLLDWYEKRLGPFPHAKLTLVQAFPKAQGAKIGRAHV